MKSMTETTELSFQELLEMFRWEVPFPSCGSCIRFSPENEHSEEWIQAAMAIYHKKMKKDCDGDCELCKHWACFDPEYRQIEGSNYYQKIPKVDVFKSYQ